MHYYQFNIKDYSFATIRMSLMEDLAFRRMLDLFYESEKSLPLEPKRVARLIGMSDFQDEIEFVLNDFWFKVDDGWVNDRALEVVEKYKLKADAARVNGKKGGRPPKAKITQSVNLDNPEISESKTNHKPLTNNHKPNKDKDILHQQIADAWNETFPELAKVIKLTSKRKAAISACIKEFGVVSKLNQIESWKDLFEYASQSDWLMGRSKEGWTMDFDFITNKTRLLKIIEGGFENDKRTT